MAPALIEVARGEHAVLTVAQALFGHRTPSLAHILRRAEEVPDPLSPAALGALEQILATGWVLSLARRGGWRRRGEKRLWQRHRSPALGFSRFAIRLCQWLAATPLGSRSEQSLELGPQSLGDQLLCYLTLDVVPTGSVQRAVARQPAIRGAALAWLGFADVLGAAGDLGPFEPSSLASDPGRVILDALGSELAARWVAMEQAKAQIVPIDDMVTLGRAQRAVLEATLRAFDGAGARELAAPFIAAAGELASAAWDPGAALDRGVTIAVRSGARREAAAFLRGLQVVAGWARQARATRFFEDDYDAAQRFLALWETLGDAGYQRLIAVADELEAMTAVGPQP